MVSASRPCWWPARCRTPARVSTCRSVPSNGRVIVDVVVELATARRCRPPPRRAPRPWAAGSTRSARCRGMSPSALREARSRARCRSPRPCGARRRPTSPRACTVRSNRPCLPEGVEHVVEERHAGVDVGLAAFRRGRAAMVMSVSLVVRVISAVLLHGALQCRLSSAWPAVLHPSQVAQLLSTSSSACEEARRFPRACRPVTRRQPGRRVSPDTLRTSTECCWCRSLPDARRARDSWSRTKLASLGYTRHARRCCVQRGDEHALALRASSCSMLVVEQRRGMRHDLLCRRSG